MALEWDYLINILNLEIDYIDLSVVKGALKKNNAPYDRSHSSDEFIEKN